uniref:Coiled-coil domain containing 9 n=1 Tax=Chelonoidis abingdonii TaxID=106734 RepID=A0A8C0FZV1_CHEAB
MGALEWGCQAPGQDGVHTLGSPGFLLWGSRSGVGRYQPSGAPHPLLSPGAPSRPCRSPQEIEEDRKKAEQEGIAVTGLRRPRHSEGEPERNGGGGMAAVGMVAIDRGGVGKLGGAQVLWRGSRVRMPSGGAAAVGRVSGRRGVGHGCWGAEGYGDKRGEWEERRRQNIEKMNEEMEKIAEYERNQRDGVQEKNPVRNFLDDPRRSGSFQEADRKEGSRRHVRNWGGPDFDKVKTGMEREKEWHGHRPGPKSGGPLDMTLSMTGRERAEYVRWKKEREQIDQERLARHRKPTGQWCREWDAEKTDTISPCPRLLTPCCPLLSDENKRPPRPPTFGEFLSEHRAERRRKGRGRPVPAKSYSSSGEEEEEAAPLVESPKGPRALKVGRGPAPKLDMPPPGAHGGQGKILSPFSPAEGYQPVSDWGEEMELNSPRGSVGDSPPQAQPPGETAGKGHWPGSAGGRGEEPVRSGGRYRAGLAWGVCPVWAMKRALVCGPRGEGSEGGSTGGASPQEIMAPNLPPAAEPGGRGTAEATRQEELAGGSMALAAPGSTERPEELGVPATQGAGGGRGLC